MTIQPRSNTRLRARFGQVCALIDVPTREGNDELVIADNLNRLRRQIDQLGVEEVFGLGDIPAGASLLLLRADIVYEFSAIAALVAQVGAGVHYKDTIAAVHVEGGDAAAALAKFRRREGTGWQPFQIRFARLGSFPDGGEKPKVWARLGRRRQSRIARAARLQGSAAAGEGASLKTLVQLWTSLPGLDGRLKSQSIQSIQFDLWQALGLKPTAWQAIGFLLLLITLSFGAFGWVWLGAAIGMFAAGCFDLAQRATTIQDLRMQPSSPAICVQALVTSCLWLFVVFAAGSGAPAQMPALVLVAVPLAFVAAQASRRFLPPFGLESAPFGLFGQAALVTAAAVSLPVPLLSVVMSGLGLASMAVVIISVATRLALNGLKKPRLALPPATQSEQPAE